MRFIGYYGYGAILTDDYSPDEVKRGLHIKNLKEDLRKNHINHMFLYDEDMNFLQKLTP